MNRIQRVIGVRCCLAVLGTVLCFGAESFATDLQRTQTGDGWGGRTDPELRRTFQTSGYIVLAAGLALATVGAAKWCDLSKCALSNECSFAMTETPAVGRDENRIATHRGPDRSSSAEPT